MIDIKLIRTQGKDVEDKLVNRNCSIKISDIVAVDKAWRQSQTKLELLLTKRNEISNKINIDIKQKKPVDKLKEEMRAFKQQIEKQELEAKTAYSKLQNLLSQVPNLPDSKVPNSLKEEDNLEVSRHGLIRKFDFEPLEHFSLGEDLGMLDFKIAVKMAGTRSALLKGGLAKLSRALANFMLDSHTESFGYLEVEPPIILNEEALYFAGQLPKFRQDLFKTIDNRYLIPTSEVSLVNTGLINNLTEDELPIRYTANTPCFRLEAGAAGRDTKGIMRLHQFTKVELVSITNQQDSNNELDRMTSAATRILDLLELPYRVVLLSRGDMGFTATKTFDIEVYLPGQKQYREISSCSNCADFQARRMNLKYLSSNKSKKLCHSLNGSGLAIGRTIIAILENYQNKDGSITIPTKLIPYFGSKTIQKS